MARAGPHPRGGPPGRAAAPRRPPGRERRAPGGPRRGGLRGGALRGDGGASGRASRRKLAELPAAASPHLPARQTAGLLLRHTGASKLTHLLRTNAPATSEAAAGAYDDALLAAYTELARLDPLTEPEQTQCRLPLRLGGRGFRSQRQLAPAAWAGSWAQNLSGVRERTGLACLAYLDTCPLPLARACRAALAGLAQLPPPPPRPGAEPAELPAWQTLAETPQRKLQKALTARIDHKNHDTLLRTLEPEAKALFRSCGGPHAGAWQTASPGLDAQRLDDADYCSTARTLLGQAAAPPGATCCNRARTGQRAGQRCGEPLGDRARHA